MRLLMLTLALVATPAAAAGDQFDLVCTSKAKTLHYRIDLAAREWCWEKCEATQRIVDVTSGRIVLRDDKAPDLTSINFIDRATGRNFRFIKSRAAGVITSDTTCEPVPFSGFPKPKF